MSIPLEYNLRHLQARWRPALATMMGIALVVAVFIMVLALGHGLRATYLTTGDERNLLVLRKGAMAESSSQITFEEVRRTKYLDGIARDGHGEPLASPEMIVLIMLQRISGGKAHVQVRGLGAVGNRLRPQFNLVQGRWFQPGRRECIVSRSISRRFAHCQLGQGFHFGKITWQIVGIFEAQKTAYDSEVWVDVDEARAAFNRTFYGAILIRPTDPAAAARLTKRIEGDKQMQLRVLTEAQYYHEQTKTAAPIQFLGVSLAVIMSVGAAFAGMNTMYAAVGARTREIGTLRALGFAPGSIYLSFLLESMIIASAGGALGCVLSLPLNGLATGAFNWETFAEVAFEFYITGTLLIYGLLFALLIGVLGGLLPAWTAARQSTLAALRAT
jgi:putative ABC transport system permease protein